MALRRTAIPLTAAELERIRRQLDPRYGFERREEPPLLAIRVPGDEPDLVNDLEEAAEALAPGDLAPTILLVGNVRELVTSPAPLKTALEARIRLDQEVARESRRALKPGSHRALAWPGDARRRSRLVVRIPGAVADLDEAALDDMALRLAPLAEDAALRGVHAVHLVGDVDEARLAGDLFWGDLLERHAEATERHRLAQELAGRVQAPAAAPPPPPPSPREELLGRLRRRLEDLGYVVRLGVGGADVAAERREPPARLVAFLPDRLDAPAAQAALEATRRLQADAGFVVCSGTEVEGVRRLVATRVRHLLPDAVATLEP